MKSSIHQVPAAHHAEVLALRDRFGDRASAVLNVLSELKTAHGALSQELLQEVAHAYYIPEARVAGLASFYSLLSTGGKPQQTIRVCDGITCWLNGAEQVWDRCQQLAAGQEEICIARSSCLGLCDRAPAALAGSQQLGPLTVMFSSLDELLSPDRSAVIPLPRQRPHETRFLLRRPTDLRGSDSDPAGIPRLDDRHIARMITAGPDEIFDLLDRADLRGMGGAGYPAVRKWRQTAAHPSPVKYVVCNADESEPLSVKDRILIDADPHRVLEGMLLAGIAVGAGKGIIYIRGEYEPQAQRLERAIEEARVDGWLGESIGGTHFSFDVHVHRGAGAYVCGEETALLESLEGKRGEPRPRPPYPPVAGLNGAPTIVNNIETLAMAAALFDYGLDDYLALSIRHARGTKLYSLFGCIKQPGLFEAPRGLTLGEAIERYGGGMTGGSEFSFALVGGAAGTFADHSCWDHRLDYARGEQTIPLGTGAVFVGDRSVSVPQALRELLYFFEVESCGKCTPCRVGTCEARRLMDQLLEGTGSRRDLARLESVSRTLQLSLCGLGTSVSSPVDSALNYFRDQFDALVEN